MKRRWRWVVALSGFALVATFVAVFVYRDPSWDWVEAHGKAARVVRANPSEDMTVNRTLHWATVTGARIETRKYAFQVVPEALWEEIGNRRFQAVWNNDAGTLKGDVWVASGMGEWLYVTKISEPNWLTRQIIALKSMFSRGG